MNTFRDKYLFFKEEIALVPISAKYGTTLGPFKIEECKVANVIRVFSEIKGITLMTEGGTEDWEDWFEWKWRWESRESFIEIDFSLLEPESMYWGGSLLKPHCTFADLIRFWNDVHAKLPIISLHDRDCELLDMRSFLVKYAKPRLEGTLNAEDNGVRDLAKKELRLYGLSGSQDLG